jgi:signal transduction histidine kinase
VARDGEVDMNQVSRSAVSILRHEIGRLTDHFSFEPGEGALSVRGNRQQLGQVVVNLLMNACQALPDRTRGVKLTTFFDPEAREVVLTVADEGCGVSPEVGKLIMEPFFTTRLDSGGTGLGLSICRSIVKAHHGTLDFISEPGRGTTFHLRLPLLEAENKDAPQ